MRLIDADELEKDGWKMHRIVRVDKDTMSYQTKKPTDFTTIEPERKKGAWKVLRDRSSGQIFSCCNKCDHYYSADTSGWNFCPNCGAMMLRGGDE